MRAFLSFLSFIFVIGVIGFAALCAYGWQAYKASGPLSEDTFFAVERGQGVAVIAANLEEQNIIDNALALRVAARLTGQDKKLHAGEYQFHAGESLENILDKLSSGDVFQRTVTIPEGLTSWQIVHLLHNILHNQNKEKHEDANDASFDKGGEQRAGESALTFPKDIEIPKEGTLLPETYSYVRGDTAEDILARMKAAMTKTIEELWPQRAKNIPVMSEAEAVILASIVEKETSVAAERKKVAGVFVNRLRIGMALQTDPTVIYAITKGKIEDKGKGPLGRRLLRKDLQIDSPYNTYKNPGLPPGPIANPGRASIEAVLSPEQHDYLYFVADGTGGHVFAKTLDEHNRNVAKWRKIRKSER